MSTPYEEERDSERRARHAERESRADSSAASGDEEAGDQPAAE
jgi:hypothetical protein